MKEGTEEKKNRGGLHKHNLSIGLVIECGSTDAPMNNKKINI